MVNRSADKNRFLASLLTLVICSIPIVALMLSNNHAIGASYIITQRSYRFQNDDGTTVNNDTNQAAANASRTGVKRGERITVRFQLDNTGNGNSSITYRMQFDKNDGNWADVTGASEVRLSLGLAGASGAAVTSPVCAANPRTWANGAWYENINVSGSIALKKNEYTELGFMVQTAFATPGTTYRLRLIESTGTPLSGYSAYPTLTIVNAANDIRSYSKDSVASLPTNTNILTYNLDDKGYSDVAAVDATRDQIASTAAYPVYLFKQKNTNNTDSIEITWTGQSSVAASSATIYMQMYNFTTATWQTVVTNNTATANTDFTLTYTQYTNLSQYYDATNWVYVRVYQTSGTEILRSDFIQVRFTTVVVTQRSYRFQNDDGITVNSDGNQTSNPDTARNSVHRGERVTVRIQLESTGTSSFVNKQLKLQFDKNDNNWSDVGALGEIRTSLGLAGASGDPITSAACAANANTWLNGAWYEGTNTTNAMTLAPSRYTEVAFMIQTGSANLGVTYRFRLYDLTDGAVLNGGYTVYPTLTMVDTAGDTINYSKDAPPVLPADATDMAYYLDLKGYTDVEADDSLDDLMASPATSPALLFKANNTGNTDNIEITWDGRSSVAPAVSPVYLQLYNFSSSTWETIASNTTSPANTDFTMTYQQISNISQYYDPANWAAARVYQAAGTQTLQTDLANITFIRPVLRQASFRFLNDDGANVNGDSFQAAADASRPSVRRGERITVRFQIDNTGTGTAVKNYRLQFDKNDNTWSDVTPAADIRPSLGLAGASGDALTSAVCTGNGNAWRNGAWYEGTNTTALTSLSSYSYTEVAFMIDSANSTLGATYRLRLYNATDDSELNGGYPVYPTITIVDQAADLSNYSKASFAAVPGDAADNPYYFDLKGYTYAAADDGNRDPMSSSAEYPVQMFKRKNSNNTDNIQITWDGQSTVDAPTAPVYLQLYDYITATWVTVSSNNTTAPNTDFSMTHEQINSTTDFYGPDNWVAIRVYQDPGTETLKTDVITVTFVQPNLRQTSYRFLNDDGVTVNDDSNQTASSDTARADVKRGERVTVRIQVQNTSGGTAQKSFRLQFDKNDGNWSDVTPATDIRPCSGLAGSSGDGLTNAICTANANTWISGLWYEDTNTTAVIPMNESTYTEVSFMINTGFTTVNTTYRLRLLNDTDSTALSGGYTTYPTMTIVDNAHDVARFSKDIQAALPGNEVDQAYYLDARGYDETATDNSVRDAVPAGSEYPIYLFKARNTNNTDPFTVMWDGQSSVAAPSANIYLQLYNYALGNWVTVSTITTGPANTDQTMTFRQSINQTDFYDFGNWIAARVYQEAGNETLRTDQFQVSFSSASITFLLEGVPNGVTLEGVTTDIDLSGSPASLNFGDLPLGSPIEAATKLTVTSAAGYTLLAEENQDLSNGSDTIAPVVADNSAPAPWPAFIPAGAFGYHTSDHSLGTGTPDRFMADDTYARMETVPREIGYSPSAVTDEVIYMVYKLQVGGDQAAGSYSNVIGYIVTGTF